MGASALVRQGKEDGGSRHQRAGRNREREGHLPRLLRAAAVSDSGRRFLPVGAQGEGQELQHEAVSVQ